MTLTRGARATGAALCIALALIEGGWIVRDLSAVRSSLDLWHSWTGRLHDTSITTTAEAPLLLAAYVTVLGNAVRRRITAGALVAAGLMTLAVRLPGLWVLTTPWMDLRATDELRMRAVYTSLAALGLGTGLLITAIAGRGAATRSTYRAPVLTSVLLGAAAGVLAGWEIRSALRSSDGDALDRFAGSESALLPLLGAPSGWLAAFTAVLALVAALGTIRSLGLVTAALLVGAGVRHLGAMLRDGVVARLKELPVEEQLMVVSWGFEATAGAVVLVLLARPEPIRPVLPMSPPAIGPPPPSAPPPGW
ncbi:hypothetical protein ABZ348_04445 [Streptomyces sp. NPDC005963]|uniref:hypothetical protein n=1 Tax=Streptomyces sp. NPDC005963 TaxID=3156721 RepID=UPI0033EDFBA5